MLVEVRPIHGWGWTDGRGTVEAPSPFEVETDRAIGKEVTGIVVTPEHDLAGYTFEASQRHIAADGHYNCSVKAPPSTVADGIEASLAGYCIMDQSPTPAR